MEKKQLTVSLPQCVNEVWSFDYPAVSEMLYLKYLQSISLPDSIAHPLFRSDYHLHVIGD